MFDVGITKGECTARNLAMITNVGIDVKNLSH
jgi:hypothetical protein